MALVNSIISGHRRLLEEHLMNHTVDLSGVNPTKIKTA